MKCRCQHKGSGKLIEKPCALDLKLGHLVWEQSCGQDLDNQRIYFDSPGLRNIKLVTVLFSFTRKLYLCFFKFTDKMLSMTLRVSDVDI